MNDICSMAFNTTATSAVSFLNQIFGDTIDKDRRPIMRFQYTVKIFFQRCKLQENTIKVFSKFYF